MNIRDRIVQRRRERIQAEGHDFGHLVPATRSAPLVPFDRAPLCICEIKRRSPSRGQLAENLDPVTQAGIYRAQGCQSVSILTEEDHFGGSLRDLMAVKQAYPDLAVLRKDFLLDRADIDTAWRAGADAVLLIAGMLSATVLADLHAYAASLGLQVLVEVHDPSDIDDVRPLQPPLTGINSRNLKDFSIDLLLPLRQAWHIDWPCTLVFESGLQDQADARFALQAGFGGVLVGEAVVRDPQRVAALRRGLDFPAPADSAAYFWNRLARRDHSPLIKICGLARIEDAVAASDTGADLLGFVFAPSPRLATLAVLEAAAQLPQPRVAVVVAKRADDPAAATLPDDVLTAARAGLIDAIQFSGDESPDECQALAASLDLPWYKALRPRTAGDLAQAERWRSPRILLDAWSATAYGGSGHQAPGDVLNAWQGPLWLAGGLNADNIAATVQRWQPELVDVASGIEASPGVKDHSALRRFIQGART